VLYSFVAEGAIAFGGLSEYTNVMKYNHYGMPTFSCFEGEIRLEHLKMTVSDHKAHPLRFQLMRFDEDAPYPDLVKTVPHLAFEVEDLKEAIAGHNIIIAPNSPMDGLTVAFIEVDGAPVELMEIDRSICEEEI